MRANWKGQRAHAAFRRITGTADFTLKLDDTVDQKASEKAVPGHDKTVFRKD
jgi:hypothetical protein